MSKDELGKRLARLDAMARKLRALEEEARKERAALTASSEPRLDAGYSMLTREVGEAAKVAETLSRNPYLVGA